MSIQNFPVLLGESVESAIDGRNRFPFRSWAQSNRFEYPVEATDFLCHCGSAAEAWFAREFIRRNNNLTYEGAVAFADNGSSLTLQKVAGRHRIDAVVEQGNKSLAVEIDGMQWHWRNTGQIADDYIRQRRIVLLGYTVIRFTAPEVFKDSAECWRQVEAVLERRGRAS